MGKGVLPFKKASWGAGVRSEAGVQGRAFLCLFEILVTMIPGPNYLDLRESLFCPFLSLHFHAHPEFRGLGESGRDWKRFLNSGFFPRGNGLWCALTGLAAFGKRCKVRCEPVLAVGSQRATSRGRHPEAL